MPESELTGSARLIQPEFGLLWRLLARFNCGPAMVKTLVFETETQQIAVQHHNGRHLWRLRREEPEASDQKILANLEEEAWLTPAQTHNRLSIAEMKTMTWIALRCDLPIRWVQLIAWPPYGAD